MLNNLPKTPAPTEQQMNCKLKLHFAAVGAGVTQCSGGEHCVTQTQAAILKVRAGVFMRCLIGPSHLVPPYRTEVIFTTDCLLIILLICYSLIRWSQFIDVNDFSPGGCGEGGGGGTWVRFCWVCAAGLSEPLAHYSLFCGQL